MEGLTMAWTKIGNRYYDHDSDNDLLLKSTYDEEADEYRNCGEYTASTFFDLGESDLDTNTFNEQSAIIAAFSLPSS